jgi:2-iminobutanoate/2-iminopropanoate deaminase
MGDAAAEAEQVMENIGSILGDLGLGLGDIVKTTIFLVDIGDFAAVNEVYARFVGDEPPARSTFQVAGLPAGFQVEIEVIAAR